MTAEKVPVAIFCYNRPDHAANALAALAACAGIDECCFHIYCDGPRNADDVKAVASTRKEVDKWASRLGANVIERSENVGLSCSIVSGVSELCEIHGRTIVVEDDLVVSPGFLKYMLRGLEKYECIPEVYQISGHVFPLAKWRKPNAYFLPQTTTWGWATWRRAWKIFRWHSPGFRELLSDCRERYKFDLDGSYPYSDMLEQRLSGKNDSWGILWWYAVFAAGGLVLYPPQSLVWNAGFVGQGTHFTGDSRRKWRQTPIDRVMLPNSSGECGFPDEVAIEREAFGQVKAFLRNREWERG